MILIIESTVHGSMVVRVDDEDYADVGSFRWYVQRSGNTFYAVRTHRGKRILMHRQIMGCPDDLVVDHINGEGLDNRRINLRVIDRRGNFLNSDVSRSAHGVYRSGNRWAARGYLHGRDIYLGLFQTRADALEAYRRWRWHKEEL